MKKITNELMELILKNLMLKLSSKEINEIINNLEKTILNLEKLTIFEKGQKYDLSKVEPMDFPAIKTSQKFREDEIKEFDNVDGLLKCSKNIDKKLIKV